MLTRIERSVGEITRVVAAVMLLLSVALEGAAREVEIPTPPWRNVVDADDTVVLYLLMGMAILLLVIIWVVANVTASIGSNKQLWSGLASAKAKNVAILIGASILFPSSVLADGSGTESFIPVTDSIFWALVITNLFLLLVLGTMLFNLTSMIKRLKADEEMQTDTIFTQLAGTVPLENEEDIMLDHEYDGIRELDNKLPPWWLYMFYFTIIFGVVYFPYYHMGSGELQTEEFNRTMQIAEAERAERLAKLANNVDENSVTLMTESADLAAGKKLFVTYCRPCHLEHGGGSASSVGPNLTDEYWLHGGGIKEVFATIKYGVPQKGMISWESQLNPPQMQQVASFILSLQGTKPEGAKEPQGKLWNPGDEVTSTDSEGEESSADSESVELKEYEQLTDEASLKAGKVVYDAMCMACHGAEGQGTIGPNFTDEYWVHGGDMAHIMEIIRVGNPKKGMIAWETQLSEEERQKVASYIMSFQGTKPADGKAPEGEKWEN